ncbi:hypothetical protein D3C76_1595740 [compost metagenome]
MITNSDCGITTATKVSANNCSGVIQPSASNRQPTPRLTNRITGTLKAIEENASRRSSGLTQPAYCSLNWLTAC